MDRYMTPAIRTEHMSDQEWQFKLEQMHARAMATQQYKLGCLSEADHLQALRENGIHDPRVLSLLWAEGRLHNGV